MKNYLLFTLCLLVVSACAGSKYDVRQDKDAGTSCFEVEDEMGKLEGKDSDRAVARYNALKDLHKKKNCG